MGELGVISPNRAAVGNEESGVFLAGDVIERLIEVAGDLGAVLALEMDVLAVSKLELVEEGVVDVGDLGEFAAGDGEEFVGTIDGGDLRGDVAGFGDGKGIDHEAAGNGASEVFATRRDAEKVLRAVVVGDEVDGLAVGRETRRADHAVEGKSEDFGWSAGGRRDGKMARGVVEEVRVEHRDVSDGLAVGRPCGLIVEARVGGDLSEMSALVGIAGVDGPDVGVVSEVRIGSGAVAGEGDELAVGRPGGFGVVEVPRSDLG